MRLPLALGMVLCLASAPNAIRQDDQVHQPGNGVSAPTPVHEVKPQYTPEAMNARIQGSVVVEAVVLTDGKVGDVKVVRSLDAEQGLDRQAVEAMKQWTFKPGVKDGKMVAVRVQVEMTFTLKSDE